MVGAGHPESSTFFVTRKYASHFWHLGIEGEADRIARAASKTAGLFPGFWTFLLRTLHSPYSPAPTPVNRPNFLKSWVLEVQIAI